MAATSQHPGKEDTPSFHPQRGGKNSGKKKTYRIWGFPKMVGSPITMGFPTKNDHFEVFWGYHHFRKSPYFLGVRTCWLIESPLFVTFFVKPSTLNQTPTNEQTVWFFSIGKNNPPKNTFHLKAQQKILPSKKKSDKIYLDVPGGS